MIVGCNEGRSPAQALRQESKLRPSVKEVQCGRLLPLLATAAGDDRIAKDLRRSGRVGVRVGRPGGSACTSDGRLRLRPGAVSEVHGRGGLWQHRRDAQRQSVAESTKEVVGCVPLRRHGGPRPRGRQRGSLRRGLGRRRISQRTPRLFFVAFTN